ncbi:MAG TPA: SH3 domain-containing protein [Spongiibacteraceae bacterium]|nr:SH3 domain-containing protein [Spongiibacteraceae bacterium]
MLVGNAKKLSVFLLVFSGLLISVVARATDEYVSVQIADPYIELHTGPGRGYPIFYIAQRGETVQVLKQRTDWYKVRTVKGKEGWVALEQMGRTLDDGQPLAVNYPTFAAYTKRQWEGGFMTGSFAGADTVSLYGGYHFTTNISAELEAGQYFGDFSNGKFATGNLVLQPFPEWRIAPFVTLGTGILWTEPKATLVNTKDRSDQVVDAGIGVRYYLTRRFLLRAQYKNYVVLTDRDTNQNAEEWKIGISTFF